MHKDLIIYGGGIIGGALALALKDSGLSMALIEARAAPALAPSETWDTRMYAVSPGSVTFLTQLGVWDATSSRIQAIRQMQVWGDDGTASIVFDAKAVGLAELGFIVEASFMHRHIWQALGNQTDLELICPAQAEQLDIGAQGAQLHLSDGRQLTGELLIGADGAESWVRAAAQMEADSSSYDQVGIVANFECELTHDGTARQWFQKNGVLAWLPMPGKRISIVWSLQRDAAEGIMALAPDVFAQRCEEAGKHTLGQLRLMNAPAVFPLRLTRLARTIKPHLALIGDAAHNLHPLAGQGINLGFRDARVLAQILRDRHPMQDCGDYFLLRKYERARREDVLVTQWLTHGLHRLFGANVPGIKQVRNWGLSLTNQQHWLKTQLMRHAIN